MVDVIIILLSKKAMAAYPLNKEQTVHRTTLMQRDAGQNTAVYYNHTKDNRYSCFWKLDLAASLYIRT